MSVRIAAHQNKTNPLRPVHPRTQLRPPKRPQRQAMSAPADEAACGWLRRRWLTTTLIVVPGVLLSVTSVMIWHRSYDGDSLNFLSGVGTAEATGSKNPNAGKQTNNRNKSMGANANANANGNAASMVPRKLLELGVYDESNDFVNEQGISPTGWENSNDDPTIWGPCRFLPVPPASSFSMTDISWTNRRRRIPSDGRHEENNNNNSNSNNKNSADGDDGGNPTGNATHPKSSEYYRNADLMDFEYRRVIQTTRAINNDHKSPNGSDSDSPRFTGGWCRPGFLIIGAGKCGTSSLYHYLMGHPRVVPAMEKQIHYFKYYAKSKPLEWYYGHFPTPQSFLEHGALMTGEASPGYLPYPDVASIVYQTYSGTSKNGAGSGSLGKPLPIFLANPSHRSRAPAVPPRIIAIGREPLDRIYSSYRYNYVVPTIEHLRKRGHPSLPSQEKTTHKHPKAKAKANGKDTASSEKPIVELNHPDDEYYEPYLFSLEDFVRAELAQLKACLNDWGPGKTYAAWHRDATYGEAIRLRNGPFASNGGNATTASNADGTPPPLIDLDGVCYGKTVSKHVYREQWREMQTNNPEHKVVLNGNLHLTQALIGRSLYTFPLEWWYLNSEQHGPDPPPIFVCTEELADPQTLRDLAVNLGLPEFDGFDGILADGAYNVGGHRGYDKATSWEEFELKKDSLANATHHRSANNNTNDNNNNNNNNKDGTNGIPLPEDLYRELKDFIDPLNERLFALTGKRCNW